MDGTGRTDVTGLLADIRRGDIAATERLVGLIYDELRRQASFFMSRERPDHTMQPTALVNDALCRLLAGNELGDLKNRAHLFGAVVKAMHRVLVDHARRRKSVKRGGDREKVSLDSVSPLADDPSRDVLDTLTQGEDLLALDAALEELAALSERQHAVFMLHYYGGLKAADTAALLGCSKATVERDLRIARAWLRGRLRS
ncbi:MAG: sigma-70 family RNA polymerase sigma factor [Planctomycetes bacterium]|nr:sigma-70 family RNA polymerase sigma factor [Planctomycetota bacterium]